MEATFLGNKALMELPKTAFLSSRTIAPAAVMRCYDWASRQRDAGRCVISGFCSPLEKDVLHFLLKGTQPVVMVLGRALYKDIPEELSKPLEDNRLLIVSPVSQSVLRQSRRTALQRNRYILEHADCAVFGSLSEESSLYPLYTECKTKGKKTEIL